MQLGINQLRWMAQTVLSEPMKSTSQHLKEGINHSNQNQSSSNDLQAMEIPAQWNLWLQMANNSATIKPPHKKYRRQVWKWHQQQKNFRTDVCIPS